jgi:PilZ domain
MIGVPLCIAFGVIYLRLPNPGRAIRKTMSRIFEALRHAQSHRSEQPETTLLHTSLAEISDRRKTKRSPLDVSVYVYGHGPGKETFHEEARTLNVSEGGALLLLSVPVEKGQLLLLTNQITEQEMDCRVVYLGIKHSRTVETGIVLSRTNPEFWQTHVPPTEDHAV